MFQATFPNIEVAGSGMLLARFETSHGNILASLEEKRAPKTVRNFVGLALGTQKWKDPRSHDGKEGREFYDGTILHRIIPGFVVQGGDRLGTGMGGPGFRFDDEIHPELVHARAGVLSMAHSGKNTSGSQFFFTLAPCPWLDGQHNVFGSVVDGMGVLESIAKVETDARDRPKKPLLLRSVKIFRQ